MIGRIEHTTRIESCELVGKIRLHPISEGLISTRIRIESAAQVAGRTPGDVRLLAVSKLQSATAIAAAVAAGQREFGENYVQEAVAKIVQLNDAAIVWHFIGAIQSNKTREIAQHFAWIHTIDRLKVAERLSKQCPDGRILNVLDQVNIDADPPKAGVPPEETAMLLAAINPLPGLAVRGLMTILERDGDPTDSFRRMRDLFDALAPGQGPGWDTLSMGMSADLEAAVTAGATLVRVGRDIFGERSEPPA
jgi:pyridoxal phosphate enzyme (YggS family)